MRATVIVTFLAIGVGCSWFGSGSAVHLQSGPQAPAAQGEVKTKLTKDGNTAVTVTVKHLAPPDRLARDATTYVVWAHPLGTPAGARPETGGPSESVFFNLGGLKIDRDLNGDLTTTTPYHSFDVLITPEPSASVSKPTNNRALWATVTHD
jgi:hypothetical protein